MLYHRSQPHGREWWGVWHSQCEANIHVHNQVSHLSYPPTMPAKHRQLKAIANPDCPPLTLTWLSPMYITPVLLSDHLSHKWSNPPWGTPVHDQFDTFYPTIMPVRHRQLRTNPSCGGQYRHPTDWEAVKTATHCLLLDHGREWWGEGYIKLGNSGQLWK